MPQANGPFALYVFHIATVAAHATASIVLYSLWWACHLDQTDSRLLLPSRYELPPGTDKALAFRDAQGWSEEGETSSLVLNPFALVFAFETITTAFALFHLRALVRNVQGGSIAILIVSCTLYVIAISVTHSFHLLEFCAVVTSYVLALFACSAYHRQRPQEPGYSGRVLRVPAVLKSAHEPEAEFEDDGVVFRYLEYSITAPLLFWSVLCLFVQDPPAWLGFAAYCLMAGCNLSGVAYHLDFTSPAHTQAAPRPRHWVLQVMPDTSRWRTVADEWLMLLFNWGRWSEQKINRVCYLEMAWLSMLVPVVSLVYLSRSWLFDGEVPALVKAMVWNLLLSYTSFGLIPSVLYVLDVHTDKLPLVLDVLNLAAKLPIAVEVILGFLLRPAGFPGCL